MRYWNPRRAAAYRISSEAIAKFGTEGLEKALGGRQEMKPIGEVKAALTASQPGQNGQTSELYSKLSGLSMRNDGIFKLVVEEMSKSILVAGQRGVKED